MNRIVCDFLTESKRSSPFKGGVPGPDWWAGFKRRWPSLTESRPQHLSAARTSDANPTTINSWFDKVSSFFHDVGLMANARMTTRTGCGTVMRLAFVLVLLARKSMLGKVHALCTKLEEPQTTNTSR